MGKNFSLFKLCQVVDMVTVNMTTATLLTRRLLPAMLAAGRGAVINISSLAAYSPGPYLAQYFATKHYLHAWSAVGHVFLYDMF